VNRTQLIAVAAEIRRAGPGDQDAIREFLDGLSVQTRYLRFFAGFSPTSPSMLRILTGGTGDVLLAWADGMVVGHAMAAYVPGPGGPGQLAHLGIVVADARQGQGIGSALMDAVTATARAHGASGLVMDVLRGNARMLGMIARRWPAASYESAGDCVTINTPLPGTPMARPPAPASPARMLAAGA
jgi:ribosomal protein S18 acetylase RimI-like enzyme